MNGLENVKILSLFNTAIVSKLTVNGKLAIALMLRVKTHERGLNWY